jgi:hexosaminidase
MKRTSLSLLALTLAGCGGSQPCPTSAAPGAPPAATNAPAAQAPAPSVPELPHSKYAIVPRPSKVTDGEGTFTLGPKTHISFDARSEKTVAPVAKYLAALVGPSLGATLTAERAPAGGAKEGIHLALDPAMKEDEGYKLSVKSDKIEISAKQPKGLFYGVQTLRQLLPPDVEGKNTAPSAGFAVPAVEIEDAPRFKYRGMHLDTSRHFFPAPFVKKFIDTIAMYKMNTFHWHLTDDQGWRIEIKKYPKLTEVGGWRKETAIGHDREQPHKFDGQRYGGFYTQAEIRDIVAYASQRHITILPEIEMPGHSQAALAAYPELGCTKGPFEVGTKWGIYQDIYCPSEKTFSFMQDVLTEVIALFPSSYIHIGGDEVKKARWKESQAVQDLIKREHLKDEEEVQSYFIRRIAKFLKQKGRHLVGWDEILEGGLAPDATVMSWRGFNGGIEAAKQGHDVIMTPEDFVYFDHYQDSDTAKEPLAIGGYTPVEKVYEFEPVLDSFTPEQAAHVVGAQGNVWSEYIPSTAQVEYMTFPRAIALAEVLWTAKSARNWDDFADRLSPHFKRLELLDVKTARHFFKVKQKFELNAQGLPAVTLRTNARDPVHFTLDGTDPTPEAPLFQSPIVIDRTATVKAVAARDGKALSSPIAVTYHVDFATGKPVKYAFPFSDKYAAAREFALTNSQKGSTNFGDGQWLGFDGQDLDATLDLGKPTPAKRLELGFLRDVGVWVMLPGSVEFMVSNDGKDFRSVATVKNDVDDRDPKPVVKDFTATLDGSSVRFVRVRAKNYGKLPAWHPGAGNPAWLFTDELIVE